MGKPNSKNENNSDNLITVVQNQENHSQDHEQQTLILWLILVAVLFQLAFTLYAAYTKRERKNALRAARSIAAIDAV